MIVNPTEIYRESETQNPVNPHPGPLMLNLYKRGTCLA